MKPEMKKNLISFSIFFLLFLFAFRKLWPVGMLAYGDSPPFPENYREAFSAFFSAFQPISRGITNPQTLVTFFQGILIFITGNKAVLAQHIFYFSPFLISFITIYLFLNRFIKNHFAKFIASFFYAVNPASIGAFLGGATGMLYIHALLPWVILTLWNLTKEENHLKNTLLFTLSFSLAFNFGAYLPYLIFPIFLFFLFKLLFEKKFKLASVFLGKTLFALFFSILLTLPFYFYSLPFVPKPNAPTISQATLEQDLRITYSQDQLLNIGLGGTYYNIPNLNWAFPFGYLLPILAFSSFFFIERRKIKYALIFSFGILLILLFAIFTHLGLTFFLFKASPYFLTFRSPAKLVLLLALFYAPLLGFTTEGILSLIKEKTLSKIFLFLFLFFILVLISLYNFPFFVGDMTLRESRKKISEITIPNYQKRIASYLSEKQKEEGPFRTYWLPFPYEDVELKIRWLDQESFNTPLGFENLATSPILDYISFVKEAIKDQETKNLGALLSYANVKYLIIPKNLTIKTKEDDPQKIIEFFQKQKDLKLILNDPDFLIFENLKFIPFISLYSQIMTIPKKELNQKSFLSFDPKNKLLVFAEDLSQKQKEMIFKPKEKGGILKTKKVSDSFYQIEIENKEPQIIFLSEPYHESWQAFLGREKLLHFSAFYQNAFYLEKTGKNKIDIYFKGQKQRDKIILVWAFSWLFFISLLFYPLRSKKGLTR